MGMSSRGKAAALPPCQVHHLRWLDPSTFVLRVDRVGLEFRAGQCVSLGIWGAGVNREYSIYSGEGDPHLEFLIKVIQGGTVSPRLAQLGPGDRVYLAGPYSDFALPSNPHQQPLLFVATGTGIAPFHSFVRTVEGLDYRLLHGIRETAHCHDRQDYAPERYIPCVSRDSAGARGVRVTDHLKTARLDPRTEAYLCGNHAMIEDAYELLLAAGLAPDRIHSEVFF
jgi:ferredoxin--NADP+ reductase